MAKLYYEIEMRSKTVTQCVSDTVMAFNKCNDL